MNDSQSQSHPRGVSRRAMLTGVGVAAAGAATGASLTLADMAGAAGDSQNGGSAPVPTSNPGLGESFIEALPNPKTLMLNTLSWVAVNNTAYTYVVPGGVRSTAADFWNCPIDLPAGSTIRSVSIFINPGGSVRSFSLTRYNGAAASFVTEISGNTTAGNVVETATIANINHVVLPSPEAYRIDNLNINATAALYGGVVDYLPPPTGFRPLSPIPRVYNSRDSALPKLAAGEERVISLAPHVPATAQAAVVNLTVTQTVIGGFVSVFPANVAFPGNSSINWTTTGADVANLVITGIDDAAAIKIRGGGDAAHVIIDVVGYLTI